MALSFYHEKEKIDVFQMHGVKSLVQNSEGKYYFTFTPGMNCSSEALDFYRKKLHDYDKELCVIRSELEYPLKDSEEEYRWVLYKKYQTADGYDSDEDKMNGGGYGALWLDAEKLCIEIIRGTINKQLKIQINGIRMIVKKHRSYLYVF